jgi:hypothetical protein
MTNKTTHKLPSLDEIDQLYLGIERARGTVELIAQALSDKVIQTNGYVSANGLAAVLSAAVRDLDRACETVMDLPRRF